jgi:hypothetical protein
MDEMAVSAAVAVTQVMLCHVSSVEQAQILAQILEKDDRNALNELQGALQALLGGDPAEVPHAAVPTGSNEYIRVDVSKGVLGDKLHHNNNHNVKKGKKRVIEDDDNFNGAMISDANFHSNHQRGGKKVKLRR